MKIFFLGGTFDPPHLGHLAISKICLKHCNKFIFIPSKQNPYKDNPYFSSSDRVEMLKIMVSKIKNIEVDLFEINSENKVNYSIDTIKYLTEKYKDDSISMVLGEDILNTLKKWKQWNQIKEMVNIVCITRPGHNKISYDDKNDIVFINELNANISSSLIREKILSDDLNQFLNIDNMLDKDVFNYILDNNKICQH